MRKVLLSLLVLALAAPSFAAVNITAEDATDGVLKLSYECTAGEVIRGLALQLDVTNDGDGVVATSADGTVLEVGFNTFIDSAYTIESGAPGTYVIGAGHAFANSAAAGEASFPATLYSISMGALDESGNQGGVTGAGELMTIKYTGTKDTLVAISADTIRGGIVGDGITEVNIQAEQLIVLGGECMLPSHPSYAQWVAVGKPDCWCASVNPRQCKGDADGLAQGKQNYWVSTNDLAIMLAAWNKPVEQLVDNQICADVDHLPQGKQNYRVSTNDLAILLANWNLANGPAADCQ
ncbi:MAG: hypothetical protein JXB18_14780 [Sedimentisphaerales bacterium]|nr:hypothetical protein [Sedimentisphaerales bacterium]